MFKPQAPTLLDAATSQISVFAFITIMFRDLSEWSNAVTLKGNSKGTDEGNPVTETWLLIVALVALLAGLLLRPDASSVFFLGGTTVLAQETIDFLSSRWTPFSQLGPQHVS